MPFPSRSASVSLPAPVHGTVVFAVCTGNVCRSPQLERLLPLKLDAAAVPGSAELIFESAGTLAQQGHPMEPHAARQAERRGAATAGHRSRRLRAEHIEKSSLVLALAREHRSAAVSLAPSAMRRVFTLTEFAALASHIQDDRRECDRVLEAAGSGRSPDLLRALVTRASVLRGVVPPPMRLDVLDPMGLDEQQFIDSADSIEVAVDHIVRALVRLRDA